MTCGGGTFFTTSLCGRCSCGRVGHELWRSSWCTSPSVLRRQRRWCSKLWPHDLWRWHFLHLLFFGLRCCPWLECTILKCHNIRFCPGIGDAHGFVQENETLQRPQSVSGAGDVSENNEGLGLLFQGRRGHNVNDLAVGGKELQQCALEVWNL